jgi:MFS family permease
MDDSRLATPAPPPPAPPASRAARQPQTPPRLYREPDFRRLWCVGLVVFVVRWVEMIAIGVFVWQQTGSAFLVAAMTMLRMLPMGLFGAFIGAAAERMQRRTALILVVVMMMAASVALALLAFMGRLAIWHIALACFINGIGWAADNPVRRMMIGEAVGPERMGAAMSLDVGSNNASRMLGPTIGGVLLAAVGIEGAFALGALLYLPALAAALRLRHRNAPAAAAPRGVLAHVAEGLAAVRQDRRLVGILAITVIFNVFGWPFTSMIPVIGQDRLGLGAEGVGLLASADGVGAFCGAVALALWARPAFYKWLYLGGITLYHVMLTVFALAPDPFTAGAALVLTGIGGAGFSTMQATLVYLAAPPEMRGRVLGILSVCIGLGLVGFIQLGLLAEAIGAPRATAATGLAGLAALALTHRWWRAI